MPFTIEELTLLDMYRTANVEQTKEEIQKVLPFIEDANMLALAESVHLKLDKISTNQFNQLDFTSTLSPKNVDIAEL